MAIVVGTPDVEGLGAAMAALREWQYEGAPPQLHPGDLGWFGRFGADTLASALRTWSRGGRILAVGLLDGPGLLRMTIAPDALHDEELARQVAADVADPERDVMTPGEAYVEAPMRALLQDVLAEQGWEGDEPWTPLHRGLGEAVTEPDLRIEVVGSRPEYPGEHMPGQEQGQEQGPEHALEYRPEQLAAQVAARVAVQRAAFEKSTFTEARWHTMAAGAVYADARCLVAYDDHDEAVAAVTVWSAGPGRPGLLEPMGVHRDHRGRGYGRAISQAAAAALRRLGASSAIVSTPSSNVGAVATYQAAGFQARPEVRDMRRNG